MNNFSKTYDDNLTKESKTIYQLRDEHYNDVESRIYDDVSPYYDFHNGLEKIIEETIENEEKLSEILFSMEIIDENGDEILEEEEEDNE